MHPVTIKRTMLSLIAVVLVVLAVGCASQVNEANAAIDTANDHLEAYTRAGIELERLMSRAESLPMDPEGAKQGVALTEGMVAKLEEQRAAGVAARDQLKRIEEMDVREEFKTYADKEIAVAEVLLKQVSATRSIVDDLREVYELVASSAGTQKQVDVIGQRIEAQSANLTKLEDEAARAERDASEYFDKQQLGGGT